MKYEHSFAKQLLKRQGYKIFIGNERILHKNVPTFNFPDFETKIKKYQDISETSDKIEEWTYSDLNREGFMIVSEGVTDTERWRWKQGVKYSITRINPYKKDYNQIPQDHFIEYDPVYKKIRLCGPNAGENQRGPWISLTRNKPSKLKINNYADASNYVYSRLNPLANIKKEEYINVPEIPMLITDAGELICIDPKSKDAPVIGCTGMRGQGKTMVIHNVADNVYKKKLGMQYHLNDRRGTLLRWCMIQNYKPFIKMLELINHKPIRLPIVPLYPNVFDLKNVAYEEENISFRITVPFDDFAKEHTYWTERLKAWQLKGASLTVFRDLMEKAGTKNRKTREEIMEDLQDFIDVEKDKLMFNAIKNRLTDIFNQEFLDVSSGIKSRWTVKKKNKTMALFPPSALMIAGLIPIIETEHLVNKEYYPQIIRWTQNTITKDIAKLNDGIRTWNFIDEIAEIVKKGKKKTVCWDSIVNNIMTGRNINLANLWTLQTYRSLDDDVKTNTNFLFAFHTNNKEDLNEIKNNYDLAPKFVNNIKNADKLCAVAMSSDDKFIVYSPDEEKPIKDSGPFYGKILPSMSYHKPGSGE